MQFSSMFIVHLRTNFHAFGWNVLLFNSTAKSKQTVPAECLTHSKSIALLNAALLCTVY